MIKFFARIGYGADIEWCKAEVKPYGPGFQILKVVSSSDGRHEGDRHYASDFCARVGFESAFDSLNEAVDAALARYDSETELLRKKVAEREKKFIQIVENSHKVRTP